MIFKNLFILLLLNYYFSNIFCENVVRPIFQFIMANEPLCGDPFLDPNWLPALEDCQIDCDISSQLCQERTDKSFPGQRCMNLPFACKNKIKQMLNLDPDMPALQLPLAPLTTPSPSPDPPSAFKQGSDNDVNDEGEMPGMEPEMPLALPTTTPIFSPTVQDNMLQPPVVQSFRDPEFPQPSAPAYEPMPPSYNPLSEIDTTTISPPPMPSNEPYFAPAVTMQNSVTLPLTTMPPDYEDERNVDTQVKIPASWGETAGGGQYQSKTEGLFEETELPFERNYEIFDTTMRPPYLMGPTTSRQRKPWSWIDLEKKLQHRPFYSIEQSRAVEDLSLNCCQWALDGLCDRSWQRVRQLCPKSCGTVVCTSIDGGLSCNRAIDVDVLDCFQRRRFFMLHAAPLNYRPQEYQRQIARPITYHRKQPSKEESNLYRAYAVENEIKGFNTGFK